MDKNMMNWAHFVAFSLVVVGALNWGLIGFMNFNLVEAIFGVGGLSTLVYVLVGLSAVYVLLTHKGDCATCQELMSGKKKRK